MSKKKKHEVRPPLNVKGGIRAQMSYSRYARVWWSRRWTQMVEAFRLGARLGRGRQYAVSGQVSTLQIQPGEVVATVQGSGKKPYIIRISFRILEPDVKVRVMQQLRQHPMYIARLLVSDLPLEVEQLFNAEGCPLFPQRDKDLVSHCSCPDYANPCKHVAAVYYLLGEAIAQNPLLLLALRGIAREDLALVSPSSEAIDVIDISAAVAVGDDVRLDMKIVSHAPLIQRLGALPFWRGRDRFTDTLEHLYARAATRGWIVWTGETLDLRREDEKVVMKGANLHLKNRKMRVDNSWI